MPYYNTLKLAFLLWLQAPRYGGAQRLQREVIQPLLARAQPHIDDFLAGVKYSLVRKGGQVHLSLACSLPGAAGSNAKGVWGMGDAKENRGGSARAKHAVHRGGQGTSVFTSSRRRHLLGIEGRSHSPVVQRKALPFRGRYFY